MIVSQAPPQPPVEVPLEAQFVLWPVLALWIGSLLRVPAPRRRLPSLGHEAMLVSAAVMADVAVVVARLRWPSSSADSLLLVLLWLAVLLSLTGFIVLRAPRDDRGGGSAEDGPEPPWWPEFERSFRDYARSRPRPQQRPRIPAGNRS